MLKSGGEANNEIHGCLIALYGFLMLKLKRAEISSATKEAMNSFSTLLALLVDRYNQLKKGKLSFPKEKSN
jgi:flagellin-specific chaperone FliS